MSAEVQVEVLSARDEALSHTLARLRDFVSHAGRKVGLAPRAIYNLKLAIDEIATNIVMYAYPDSTDDDLITVTIRILSDRLEVTLEDTGIVYNPRQHQTPKDLSTPLDTRELGGLGIYFALRNVDEFNYRYENGCNVNQFVMYRPLTEVRPNKDYAILLFTQTDSQGVSGIIKHHDYNITIVENRQAVMEHLHDYPQDLLIIDSDIRPEDAFRLLKVIRMSSFSGDIPILVIGKDGVYISRCIELGASDFLIHPLDPLLIELRIRTLMRQSQVVMKNRLKKLSTHIKEILLSDRPEVRFGRDMNIDYFLEHVLSEVQGIYNADAGTVYLKTDDNKLIFDVMHTYSLGVHRGGTSKQPITDMPAVDLFTADGQPNHHHVVAHVVHTGESINISDIYEDDQFDFSGTRWFDRHNHYRSISTLTVPLKDHEDDVVGVIQLINAQDENGHIVPFDSAQQMLVEALCAHTAVILSNYRLLQRQAELTAMENDMRVGRRIQRDFMPEKVPQMAGWSVDARFYPAREVAGDFYDIFTVGEYGIFVLADVCDKGVGAALFMALIRSLLRAYISQARETILALPLLKQTRAALTTELRKVVQHTNDYIIEHHYELTMFATLFIAAVHLKTGRMYYINGGHSPLPVLHRASTDALYRLSPTGPAIGMFDDAWFEVKSFRFKRDDVLFVFTDGVTDAPNQHGDLLGDDEVVGIVKEAASVQDLMTHITDRVFNQQGSASQFDDMTFWAVACNLPAKD